jgi:type I restriction enzyme, S subunit
MNKSDKSWKRVPIKETYKGFYDGPHATPTPTDQGPIFLSIKNITEDGHLDLSDVKHISEQEFPRWTKRVLPQPGDIVFTYEATLHRYAVIPKDFRGCLGRRVALIRPETQKIDAKFLLYYFFGNEWYSLINEKTISGSTVDRIPLIDFPNFEISIPPLSIQKKISAVLSTYDDLIENNDRRITLLEKMAEEIYREWFVRLRFPGHEQATFHKGIPEDWESKRFDEFCLLQRGFDLPDDKVKPGIYPVVASTSIKTYHSECKVNPPVITTGRSGSLGTVLFVNSSAWPLNTTLFVKNFFGNSPYLIYYTLKFLKLENFNAGAGVPSLNRNHLGGLHMSVPPKILQNRFDENISVIFKQKENLANANEKLKQTRDRLLTRLISGKLSVEDLDIQFPPSMTEAVDTERQ